MLNTNWSESNLKEETFVERAQQHQHLPRQQQQHSSLRCRSVVGRAPNGQPRTYRLAPARAEQAAYRRLAAAILGLDVEFLASQLRSSRVQLATAA
jgi:hypothetical protein